MKLFFNQFSVALMLLWMTQIGWAQDGAGLFKTKCNTCHNVDKNSTGPMLKGVKQKWEAAGEGPLMHAWIKNSAALIASGKSTVANASQNFSPTVMPIQNVSDAEIDAIFQYVDTYVPPVQKTDTVAGTEVVKMVPNYKANQTAFFFLISMTIILLLAIILIAGSITTFIKSDYFKEKIRKKEERDNAFKNTIMLLAAFFSYMMLKNESLALSFVPNHDPESNKPWLLIENADLYYILTINILLLGVVVYLRRVFKTFVTMVRPATEDAAKPGKSAMKKLNVILTDSVPIEQEAKILMDHEYDGIRELDNNLPPWWVWGFFATIIFAFIYMFHYHIFKTGDLQTAAYNKEMIQSAKDVDAYLAKMAMNVDETNATVLTEPDALATGKAIFTANCVVCHNPKGEGNIGPNLTDDRWIYSPDIKEIFKTIKKGTANGMPEHASKLNPVQIQEVASYVLSLPFAEGKEPEGKAYNEAGEPVN